MFLTYQPADLKKDQPCIPVLGDYTYTDERVSSFKLEGEFCFDMGMVTLHSKKGKKRLRSFKGKFDEQVHSITGKWTQDAEEQPVFELINNCKKIDQNTLLLFANKLDEHLSQSKNCRVDKVGFDEKGIFIKNLSGENLTLSNFSPTQLEWSTWSDSEQQRTDFKESVDLWFYDGNSAFVIVINSINWIEKKGADGPIKESETQHTEVWKYDGNQFENIFVEAADKADLSEVVWYAVRTNETIQLHENKTGGLWEWR